MPIRVRPILVWVLIQLFALGIGAAGLPVWVHHPFPREALAVEEMMVIQVGAAAMLFPLLLPSAITMTVCVALVWPLAQLAGFLSGAPQGNVVAGCIYISVWIAGLWWCGELLRSPAEMGVGVCLAELFAVGGALMWYFALESGTLAHGEFFGPLVGVVKVASGAGVGFWGWGVCCLPGVVGSVARLKVKPRESSRDSKRG